MGEREPTARLREVGHLLRDVRESMDLTASQVAERLSWSVSKVSRVERGTAAISMAELVRGFQAGGRGGARLQEHHRAGAHR